MLREENGDSPYRLKIYDLDGKEKVNEPMDFHYLSMSVNNREILFENQQELCVYTMEGIRKFSGIISQTPVSNVIGLGKYRYYLVTEEGVSTIQLK